MSLEPNTNFRSAGDFINYFKTSGVLAREQPQVKIVLLIDSFQTVPNDKEVLQRQFYSALRHLRKMEGVVLQSVIAAGTFDVFASVTSPSLGPIPFYGNECISIPSFTDRDFTAIFRNFAADQTVTFDAAVIRHVFFMTNGYVTNLDVTFNVLIHPISYRHPALVALYGRLVKDNVELLCRDSVRVISLQSWHRTISGHTEYHYFKTSDIFELHHGEIQGQL